MCFLRPISRCYCDSNNHWVHNDHFHLSPSSNNHFSLCLSSSFFFLLPLSCLFFLPLLPGLPPPLWPLGKSFFFVLPLCCFCFLFFHFSSFRGLQLVNFCFQVIYFKFVQRSSGFLYKNLFSTLKIFVTPLL